MNYKVIILDFDGVLVESDNIKHEAFAEIFKNYPDHYESIMKYHFEHNHTPRQAKFKHFFENVLRRPCTDQDIEKMVLLFSKLTREKIIQCPYVNGAVEFLEYFYKRNPLFVASATPIDELNIIIQARGLSSYFKGVYGAPVKKTEMFKDIIKREKLIPDELLFIGDSREDLDVAGKAGINFIARISKNCFDGNDIVKFGNLEEIKNYLLKGGQ